MPRPPRPLPAALGSCFRSADAIEHGVSSGRLRARDLATPFRGVRVTSAFLADAGSDDGEPLALDRAERRRILQRARAYSTIMPPNAFFAGRTTAVLLGCPIPHDGPNGDRLTVAVFAPLRAPRRNGIHGLALSPRLASVGVHEGLRVTSPASTWAMLGPELTRRELILLGDAMVRVPRDSRGTPRPEWRLATVDTLRLSALAPGRRGRAKLLDALADVRVGSMSPLESDFRLDAAAAGLPEPELDVEIRDAGGRLLGIADVAYRGFRTLVEIEGDHHRTTRAQWNRDIGKHAAYVAAGWEVVRLTSSHIRGHRPQAAAITREVLVRRGWRPEAGL